LNNQLKLTKLTFVWGNIVVDENGVTDEDVKYICDNADCHEIKMLTLGKAKYMKEII
jgi:hypothetical protein